MYSIFDSKAEIYKTPFEQVNNAEAMRTFHDLVNDKNTIISKHPEDYDLYNIGTWDNENGKLETTKVMYLIKGTDFERNNDDY